ncbi:S-adenosyl-L-methionine-dependent methyltransferase [Auricularia subglabra TFB-10046 SS5]|nr:S-adenosyl-L-methionine-dependent methyltransferase [Auricularia subglabra TFB-10046 SS5]
MSTPAASSNIADNVDKDKDGWSAQKYNKTADFVYSKAYTSPTFDLLAAKEGEKIADFGCGTGELTLQLAALVGETGRVVGYDASANMVEKARANGVQNAFVADLQEPAFFSAFQNGDGDGDGNTTAGTLDAVFSNATLHWCKRDPAAVVRNAYALLSPGGRFVCEMGGFMNCVGVVQSLYAVLRAHGHDPVPLDPWYFPSVSEYSKILESAGFRVATIALHPRLTPLHGPLGDWLRLFARHTMLAPLDDAEAAAVISEVEAMCARDCKDKDNNWAIMYCRLRFRAEKPE